MHDGESVDMSLFIKLALTFWFQKFSCYIEDICSFRWKIVFYFTSGQTVKIPFFIPLLNLY